MEKERACPTASYLAKKIQLYKTNELKSDERKAENDSLAQRSVADVTSR